MPQWPPWWSWELELSPHLLRRMIDRSFNETELREMLEGATDFALDIEPGRFAILTSHAKHPWTVVVEPDPRK